MSDRDLEIMRDNVNMLRFKDMAPGSVDTMGLYSTPTDPSDQVGGRMSDRDLEIMRSVFDGEMLPADNRLSDRDFETIRSGPPYPYQSGGHVQRMAQGGYSSRGTVAGELPRYGNMSVREEGETMHELSKRHGDQDWYNRMSGGLGSLRRRMA